MGVKNKLNFEKIEFLIKIANFKIYTLDIYSCYFFHISIIYLILFLINNLS